MDLEENTRRAARIGEQQSAQARAFSRAAGSTFARLTRQNYALMGDIIDFTLAQMRLPVAHTDAREMLAQQSADARTLVSKARERAGEYADIVGEMRDLTMSTPSLAANTADRAVSHAVAAADAASDESMAGGRPTVAAKTVHRDDAPVEHTPRVAATEPTAEKSAATTTRASTPASEPGIASKTASKATGKTASKATSKTASKATSKAEGKTASKAAGKTASKAAGKTASKATARTASKATGKIAGKAAGKSAAATKRAAGKQATGKGGNAGKPRAGTASTRKG